MDLRSAIIATACKIDQVLVLLDRYDEANFTAYANLQMESGETPLFELLAIMKAMLTLTFRECCPTYGVLVKFRDESFPRACVCQAPRADWAARCLFDQVGPEIEWIRAHEHWKAWIGSDGQPLSGGGEGGLPSSSS